jgi:hypothetical protein
MRVVERVRSGARSVARWSPGLLLAVLLLAGFSTGAGVEPVAAVALVLAQVLFLTLPRAARWAGRQVGERQE